MPSAPPHLEFPRVDLPQYLSALRRLNLWLQQRADITTGVFPSGHVTVAIACLLGFKRAMPDRTRFLRSLHFYAALLMLATIYGRYHYAVDVFAAVGVACVTALLTDSPRRLAASCYARRHPTFGGRLPAAREVTDGQGPS